jgi:hypothetical protein
VTEIPEIIQGWVKQLLDPAFVSMVDALPIDQIDVKLSASKGKIRGNPMVVLNGGPQQLVEP